MRGSSVLLALLLLSLGGALAPLGVGAQNSNSSTQGIVSVNNSANYLSVSDENVTETGIVTADLSLATAFAGDTASLRSDLVKITFEQSFEAATTDREKTDAIRGAAQRVERGKRSLEQRERDAIGAYASGSSTTAAFIRKRARIQQEAAQLQETIQHVDRRSRSDNSYSLSTSLAARLANLGGELEVLQGPVSGHISDIASGETEPKQFYVEASENGYTVAYVTDGLYVRETYLGDQHDPNQTDQFVNRDVPRQTAADLRGYDLYPWLTNHSISPSTTGLGTSGIYKFSTDALTAYITGTTTNVFRESQRHKLDTLTFTDSRTAVNDTLRIDVNRTYETGPMQLSISRNGTGTPANTTLDVNGHTIGSTGADGSRWFVEPRGPVSVRATAVSGGNVSIVVP